MITVLIAEEERDFETLELHLHAARSSLVHPRVNGRRAKVEQHRLLLSPKITESRSYFESVAAHVRDWLRQDNMTAVVARARPLDLNPLLSKGAQSLIAMLILAFPEVAWLFGTIEGYQDDAAAGLDGAEKSARKAGNVALDQFRRAHGLWRLFAPQQPALFDGAGLRDWVRERIRDHRETGRDTAYLTKRSTLALGVDEETDYAYLHAYSAYRFGFRAFPVASRAEASLLLGAKRRRRFPPAKLEIIFEDIFLSFPDGEQGLSRLRERAKALPGLTDAEHRILVTSGQCIVGDAEKRADNQLYIAEQRACGRHIAEVRKPHAGVFSLWQKAGLMEKLRGGDGSMPGAAFGFVSPPSGRSLISTEHGHSAPGVLMLIAASLVDRAEALFEDANTVEDCVLGAVLATDALELLGCRTPTLAVAALSLKHQFEVKAECQFAGVEYHFPIQPRLKEIRDHLLVIGTWFDQADRRRAALNGELGILTQLVRVFSQFGQFEEDEECRAIARDVNRHLWLDQKASAGFRDAAFSWSLRLPWKYLNWLLGPAKNFVLAVGLWVLCFTVIHALALGGPDHLLSKEPIEAAMTGVLTGNPISGETANWWWINLFCAIIGVFHIGVFISRLYTLISRK